MAYTDYAKSQEDQARENQQFWDQWWTKFNPPTPMATPGASGPLFDQAAQRTQAAIQGQAGGGSPGTFDMAASARNLGNDAQQKTRTMDLRSFLDAQKENARRSNQLGSFDFQKSRGISDAERRIGGLPNTRRGAEIRTDDAIKAMWEAYQAGKNPFENLIGGAVGDLGGDLLADLFKEDEFNPNFMGPPTSLAGGR
jgi:hypothetical protein